MEVRFEEVCGNQKKQEHYQISHYVANREGKNLQSLFHL